MRWMQTYCEARCKTKNKMELCTLTYQLTPDDTNFSSYFVLSPHIYTRGNGVSSY